VCRSPRHSQYAFMLHLVGGNVPSSEPVGELGFWVRARRYRDRATENLHLAETAPSFDVRQRYFKVARHYLHMAELEERDAKRESGKIGSTEAVENIAAAAEHVAPITEHIAPPADHVAEPAERAA
jgi:hypothetical protein